MRHELFAILDSPEAADAALGEIGSRPEFDGRYAVVVHRDGIAQQASDPVIAHEERGAREGFRFGAVLGATGTAMVLAILEGAYGWVGNRARWRLCSAPALEAPAGRSSGRLRARPMATPNSSAWRPTCEEAGCWSAFTSTDARANTGWRRRFAATGL